MIKITKQSVKSYFTIAWREFAVIAAVLFLDILSKSLVSKFMTEGQTIELIPKFLNFHYALNTLASFNFDFFGLSKKLGEDGMRIFFIIFMSLAVACFILFLIMGHKNRFFYRLPLALIIGGAMGNLYDRIFHMGVRDFIQVEFFGKTVFGTNVFPTFNLADSALVIGVILFLIYFIFFYFKDEKKKEEAKKALEAAGDTSNISATAEPLEDNVLEVINFSEDNAVAVTESIEGNLDTERPSEIFETIENGADIDTKPVKKRGKRPV